MNIYQKAWELLLEKIQVKTGWGKIELQQLMLKCLIDAGKQERITIPAEPEEA